MAAWVVLVRTEPEPDGESVDLRWIRIWRSQHAALSF